MSLTYRQLASRLTALSAQVEKTADEAPGHTGGSIRDCATVLRSLAEQSGALRNLDPLTESQGRVLAYIRSYLHEHELPPTRREIAEALGFTSPNAAHEHIKILERRGFLTRTGSGPRGIRLHKRTVSAHEL